MAKIYAIVLALILVMASSQMSLAAPVCITNSKIGAQLDLPIYEWVDQTKKRQGTIVAVHGLTLYAACWDQMGKHLAARGYHVFALDQRGFGRWETEGAKWNGNNRVEVGQSQQDLLDLVTTLRQTHHGQKLYCLGESLGSNMILLLAEEHPELLDGAILGSPCYKARVHPKPLHWAEDLAREIVRPDHPLNLEPYAAPYLTNDAKLAQACDADPIINRKLTPGELIKFDVMDDKAIKGAKNLSANLPVLVIAGEKDAMFHSTDLPNEVLKWGTKNVQVNILPGRGHLLMEHQAVVPQVGNLIDAWLKQQQDSSAVAATPAK
jgi:alpha-beta hydrolase superfamily lysophospholipase